MTERDNPGVIMLPPLLYGIAFIVVLALRWFRPLPMFDDAVALWPGIALVILGVGIAIWGRNALKAAGTNINPSLPTTAIVKSGPFRFSRNPLYLALTLVYLGITLAVNSWWGIVVLIPLLIIMHRGVILREERYLEAKFGESYRQYCSRVRRYI
ncbi:MAG TPA: isoprenylcysteine carboxylmethyltransferase family protein [Burkholderiales bacterium]|nr:isoprenylcysteine carboxylmethyltransferase family protein [Burkholderiales bacterium]